MAIYPDHSHRILIIGVSGSVYLYVQDLSEPRYEFLIKKREDVGIKHFNDPSAFIDCSNTMDDVYENIDDYNPNGQRKTLIEFDYMIANVMTNKKFQVIINELFIRSTKLNISLVFITLLFLSYFCPKRCQIKFNT